ncbi:hypothetical protein LR48_Vigan11g056400 [Vigna angularis]|uniref:Uncharacterized protein n=1 Tax=Phaseolus angularis TaxID=3914 RepID=A0A0L9VR43_PHAAN|nr:hypothetical protein LR48_Vigan11g056400 [Vigna angularis]
MTSSSCKRIKIVGAKRKEPKRPYSNKFVSRRQEQHFLIVQDRRLLMERKAGWIPNLAPQFGEELENKNWERVATYPAPGNIAVVRDMYMSLMEARLQSIHRGQVVTTEMIIGMYDTPPERRWTMDEFNTVVAWLEEQAQTSGAGAAEAPAMEEDDEDDDDFEDAKEGEEEDSDDSMG